FSARIPWLLLPGLRGSVELGGAHLLDRPSRQQDVAAFRRDALLVRYHRLVLACFSFALQGRSPKHHDISRFYRRVAAGKHRLKTIQAGEVGRRPASGTCGGMEQVADLLERGELRGKFLRLGRTPGEEAKTGDNCYPLDENHVELLPVSLFSLSDLEE